MTLLERAKDWLMTAQSDWNSITGKTPSAFIAAIISLSYSVLAIAEEMKRGNDLREDEKNANKRGD